MSLKFWLHYHYGRLRGRPTNTMIRWIVGCKWAGITPFSCQADCGLVPVRLCKFRVGKSADEVIACLAQGKLVWSDKDVTSS